MKFRFCGERDCPDWVLAEIVLLTKMTSVKFKLVTAQVIKDILGTPIDYAKVGKHTADAKLDSAGTKIVIAIIAFFITNAAKNGVDAETLSEELQQLGLPKEHAVAACKSYDKEVAKVQDVLRTRSLRLPSLKELDWRVDYTLGSSTAVTVNEPSVQLKMKVATPGGVSDHVTRAGMTAPKFQLLLHELKQAEAIMAEQAP
eukprot:CAMPEP_0182915240 /NCGR_PEP_ID=MMETSP0105_2-20130417/195_1 /TAXON_ID=81532 ORGANISM="Acanthoeca-like sp., Strain 10tr" /NCGR_SAMPLE_ID=MMETSP0105_2 /ASSEMBLY_ACC=CAM_ASM_000205 /LENGTH=200 /DNA_ID=CAMNT_0025052081 /DNA_START=43 /DNA_END=645 /DNA_ORIENTATION=+